MKKPEETVEKYEGVERIFRHNRFRDIIFLIPIFAIFLLASPVLNTFDDNTQLLGMPLGFVQLFMSWIGLIALMAYANRKLLQFWKSKKP